jgi:hypothetical protein
LIADLETERHRIAELEVESSLDCFLQQCMIIMGSNVASVQSTIAGLKHPPGLFLPFNDIIKVEVARVYRLQVEAAARNTRKFVEQQQQQQKASQEALAKAASLKPEEVVGKAFEAFLKSKSGKKSSTGDRNVDYMKMLKVDLNPPSLVSKDAPTKNGSSPGAARGSNSSAPAAGKGSKKPKQQGKGKGKGSGSPPQGKGKGKGKGNSSPEVKAKKNDGKKSAKNSSKGSGGSGQKGGGRHK